jgi:hypothetical protein
MSVKCTGQLILNDVFTLTILGEEKILWSPFMKTFPLITLLRHDVETTAQQHDDSLRSNTPHNISRGTIR